MGQLLRFALAKQTVLLGFSNDRSDVVDRGVCGDVSNGTNDRGDWDTIAGVEIRGRGRGNVNDYPRSLLSKAMRHGDVKLSERLCDWRINCRSPSPLFSRLE